MTTNLAQLLFAPRTIALIGASGDPKKYTSRPQRFLRQYKYPGKIIPVNPGRDEVLGEKAYPNILAVPDEIDHAFIMVPTDAVEAALVQCVEKKVPIVTIYSDGFAETGAEGTVESNAVGLVGAGREGYVSNRADVLEAVAKGDGISAVAEVAADRGLGVDEGVRLAEVGGGGQFPSIEMAGDSVGGLLDVADFDIAGEEARRSGSREGGGRTEGKETDVG